ncbi:MAG: tetratricopeptide repeat protein [Phocaeicola vulgatus]|nr:MAG: tetratricopeptide repeat protein [Phocaeicola vulgatus]
MNPNYVDAWVRKGVTLFDIGKDYEALACFNKAVGLDRKSFKAFYNRGKCYYHQKYHEEALSDFLIASSLKKDHAATHDYLSELFSLQGDEEMAEKHKLIAEKLRTRRPRKS